ncbi:alpha/beta fold hydrolase [Alkalimarinus sediminis]|uniref:Alpha/beta fold hydrolase n=1 Tax=Alkalimarinus sediminis TaxID=1632866 RepID=A0A9E8KRE4_9ALTE|nr:alpha/beta hydrolase [Alkalimarinus sediminis]UZW76265.1 alpha/beta fold hydrolase [Alkalimarinus sediminis]
MENNNSKQMNESSKCPPKQQFIQAKGLEFCVEERGDPDGEAIIFIMGLACQMTHWPEALLNGLVEQGYRVIRFDNRDIGLSEKIKSTHIVDTRRAYISYKLGFHPAANYTLHNMANDTANILQALSIESAHIVGASMGGMIGQLLAAHHPDMVKSLTTIMSSTNSPRLPFPELNLMIKLSAVGRGRNDKASVLKRWKGFWKSVQSPDYPTPTKDIMALIEANYERNYSPGGTIRQIQAMLATGSLEKYIGDIAAPTLVIHGSRDPLLKPACGKAISRHVKNARFELIKGMGHDLPKQLIPEFINLIDGHIKQCAP